jgi:hypothetical protein
VPSPATMLTEQRAAMASGINAQCTAHDADNQIQHGQAQRTVPRCGSLHVLAPDNAIASAVMR